MNSSLAEKLDDALVLLEDHSRVCTTYIVDNPEEDIFDELLAQSGCVDIGGFMKTWRRQDI